MFSHPDDPSSSPRVVKSGAVDKFGWLVKAVQAITDLLLSVWQLVQSDCHGRPATNWSFWAAYLDSFYPNRQLRLIELEGKKTLSTTGRLIFCFWKVSLMDSFIVRQVSSLSHSSLSCGDSWGLMQIFTTFCE